MGYIRFIDLPKLYISGVGFMLSIPCCLIWCTCVMCSSRYGRQDMALVEAQRLERAKLAFDRQLKRRQEQGLEVGASIEAHFAATADFAAQHFPDEQEPELVDCSGAQFRDWELIYSA